MLCQLSYIGLERVVVSQQSRSLSVIEELERETGIEPATNSLEGCDSTTELLPPLPASVLVFILPSSHFGEAGPELAWPQLTLAHV